MTDEWQVVDEVTRETAEMLVDAGATVAWKADGDGAYRIERTSD